MTNKISTSYTPGPWTKCIDGTMTGRWFTIIGRLNYYDDGTPQEIARTDTIEVNSESSLNEAWLPTELGAEIEANARLIAAAPDLLAALENLRAQLRDAIKMDVKKHYSLMVADAAAGTAIAKATNA